MERARQGMKHVIELVDFDGTVGNTVMPKIEARLQPVLRRHERMARVAANILFMFGDITGAGKKHVENSELSSQMLDKELIETLKRHKEDGVEIVMRTSNGHSQRIQNLLAENGLVVEARHCDSDKKAEDTLEVMKKNPGKCVIPVNDSPWETKDEIRRGSRRNVVLFSKMHNSLYVRAVGGAYITNVATTETFDETVRRVARA